MLVIQFDEEEKRTKYSTAVKLQKQCLARPKSKVSIYKTDWEDTLLKLKHSTDIPQCDWDYIKNLIINLACMCISLPCL